MNISEKVKLLYSMIKLKVVKTIFCDSCNLRDLSKDELLNLLNLDKLNDEWKEICRIISGLRLPEFTYGINPGDQRTLFYLVRAVNAKSILEIGTHIGCSTVHLALALKQSLREDKIDKPKRRLVTVDIKDVNDLLEEPWKEYRSLHSPKKLLELTNCGEMTEFAIEDSISFLSKGSENFDFIFLDGDHSSWVIYQEISYALKLLRPNGSIMIHDYFPDNKPLWLNSAVVSGPYLAVQRLLKENSNIDILPLGNMPWSTKSGSHKTSLALIVKKSYSSIID